MPLAETLTFSLAVPEGNIAAAEPVAELPFAAAERASPIAEADLGLAAEAVAHFAEQAVLAGRAASSRSHLPKNPEAEHRNRHKTYSFRNLKRYI